MLDWTGKQVVDPTKLRPVARLGGNVYSRLTEMFEIARPDKNCVIPNFKTRAELNDEAFRMV